MILSAGKRFRTAEPLPLMETRIRAKKIGKDAARSLQELQKCRNERFLIFRLHIGMHGKAENALDRLE